MTDVYSVDVQITAPVRPTEVTDRVRDAVTNLFPEADVTEGHGELLGEAHGMETFSELLHDQEILDTARGQFLADRRERRDVCVAAPDQRHRHVERGQFLADRRGDTFSFDLKKQAAFQGVVNFAVGDPAELGDIHVRVTVTEPSVEDYIDHVAPPTEDGRPVED